jgi:hypothetical protein
VKTVHLYEKIAGLRQQMCELDQGARALPDPDAWAGEFGNESSGISLQPEAGHEMLKRNKKLMPNMNR